MTDPAAAPLVDLNCDLGEGVGNDALIMPWITSANIACAAHAGDEATMRAAVRMALRHGVGVGAHPGYPDREHFGRRELSISPDQAGDLAASQLRLLLRIAADEGAAVRHLKLHGALYNQAARDPEVAQAVLAAIESTGWRGAVMVLSGSAMDQAARQRDRLPVLSEVFADRRYEADGALTPRTIPGAVIDDQEAAVAQVVTMVTRGVVRSRQGSDVPVRAQTVCLHGDGVHAVPFAARLRQALEAAGVVVGWPAPAR